MTTTDVNYEVTHIPYKEIFSDATFNCRGEITLASVMELASEIKQSGLQQPIVVKHFTRVNQPEIKYRIIAGHRRHLACGMLRMQEIPCFIRDGLTSVEETILNVNENLQRKNLSMLQEAETCRRLALLLVPVPEIARRLEVGKEWVEIRLGLLRLPKMIQELAEIGYLNRQQIRSLIDKQECGTKDDDLIREAANYRDKKDAAERIKKHFLVSRAKGPREPDTVKLRSKTDIENAFNAIYDGLHGESLASKALAYALSQCTTASLLRDLQKECDFMGYEYTIPSHYIQNEEQERIRLGLPE